MTPLLAVEDIHTAYGLSRVLFGISFEIASGECVCLLGRNGVGKTTTIRSVMGLTPPSSGRVLWQGRDITGWAPHRVARAGIGFVPEDRRIFAEVGKDAAVLGDKADAGARYPVRRPAGDVAALPQHTAARRRRKPHDRADCRCLADAVAAQQADAFA